MKMNYENNGEPRGRDRDPDYENALGFARYALKALHETTAYLTERHMLSLDHVGDRLEGLAHRVADIAERRY
jgi:hypothetical protein